MSTRWLERLQETIADRGRELLRRNGSSQEAMPVDELCRRILAGQGEASGIALSRELLARYQAGDATAKLAFFDYLTEALGPRMEDMQGAMARYTRSGDLDDFLRLSDAVEPPRQELFRRLNMAPNGTAALVAMRADLLLLLRKHDHLRAVDADLKHLLSSWFNRGFLQLRAIDWDSPARVLEKLIDYESVHEIHGWDDLRRRLKEDRRCFAFFHPAMPDEPLIFVEVALVAGMTRQIQPLLDQQSPVGDPQQADTAMFYSINNTQTGLRSISFGNFLIKQVVSELREELPQLSRFATLSPLPRLAQTVRAALDGHAQGLSLAQLEAVLADDAEALRHAAGMDGPATAALLKRLQQDPQAVCEQHATSLTRLTLAYLNARRDDGSLIDPVAAFHLSNGARLEAINGCANLSAEGLTGAFGIMVNYLYLPDELEANHERFVSSGEMSMAKALTPLARQNETALSTLANNS